MSSAPACPSFESDAFRRADVADPVDRAFLEAFHAEGAATFDLGDEARDLCDRHRRDSAAARPGSGHRPRPTRIHDAGRRSGAVRRLAT